jgi:hypothetical protein
MGTPNRPTARRAWFSQREPVLASLRLACALALALALTACPRDIALVPKAGAEDVRLYDPELGEFPEPGYIHLGPITVVRPDGTPRSELILSLRAEAARQGADAVILQRFRGATAVVAESNGDAVGLVLAEGLAIFWP